ncbi:MAG: hypothetical protein K5874_04300 [Bacteroidaceae bacterium]|nr:hypothetical protein [Bacteroidaceae bacterium]
MIESLNNYAGLFSFLAVLAAVIVPIVIYKWERKNERQAMKDELEAMQDNSHFPMTYEEREYYTKRDKLRKGINRK